MLGENQKDFSIGQAAGAGAMGAALGGALGGGLQLLARKKRKWNN